MKPVHKHLAVAACLAVLGLSAGAQPAQPAIVAPATAPAAGPGAHHMMMHDHAARLQQRMAQRAAALKQILQLTPAQDAAWNSWVASRQPAANLPRPRPGEFAQLTTPERIDRMRALRAAHMAEMDRRAEATKTFYAALTAAQQKSFDALTASRGWGRGMGGEGRHGGWGHRAG